MRPLLLILAACGPSESDSAIELPTSGSLRVLSYNVAGLPTGLAGPPRPTPERMAAIAPKLGGYDLVGLQEDFTDEGHDLLLAEADHPVRHWFSTTVAADRAYGSGLSSLAREAELVEVFEDHYSACNGVLDGASDCLASKGFLTLRLSLGGHELDFVNTHHEAGGGADDEAARTTQVTEVLAAMSGRSADRAVVFVGDFNMRWSDPPDAVELQRYADAGLRDACDELACPEPERIDRVLVRDGGGMRLTVSDWAVEPGFEDAEGAPLSDHDPVAITLSWSVD